MTCDRLVVWIRRVWPERDNGWVIENEATEAGLALLVQGPAAVMSRIRRSLGEAR